ncbi:uncharacterized protein LOC127248793 [Andrographis paniculata]|uniref:uncharacterized protein LOC127248793 n=1 Tax=Andrographis paniculata TaxID=175694 RepID=UPI0021E8F5BC|nr:uncharacterized protein LOC127248793 [Andrographis paniculata]XP_051127278.1 uncharacterized protein LOC127248793 [Andrographis paniculata]XP_051127279.1 uncharacterized protein LOC127248793 [Andrographis paniculata]
MEKSCVGSRRHDETEFDLKEWALKARISRENTSSRRFSASNLRSFREDERSFRSNLSISSTASSPGYTVREEIDPSTYSFTTALKALQAKTVYTWEYISPDRGGVTLNPKWNDAEKYICNPLSGEVPLECLSTKTLSGRSFRSITSRITMSAPLIYPSQLQPQLQAKSPIIEQDNESAIVTIQEKRKSSTRDVGTQSTPADLSSGSSPSPAQTPSIEERSIKHTKAEGGDSSASSGKFRSETTEVERKEEVTGEKQEGEREMNGGGERKKVMRKQRVCRCDGSSSHGGCLSLKGLLHRHRHNKPRNTNLTSSPNFLCHINACYKE